MLLDDSGSGSRELSQMARIIREKIFDEKSGKHSSFIEYFAESILTSKN
jgi:hypothetical protein